MNSLQSAIDACISRETGKPFVTAGASRIGGGCIHDASCLTGEDGRRFFIKQNSASLLPSFEAESYALEQMAATGTIRVPQPVATCQAGAQAALVLEFLSMGHGSARDWNRMGRELAQMHRHSCSEYGWPHDNWIGATPQNNTPEKDWICFLIQCRLQPQIEWARRKHLSLQAADALMEKLPAFFSGYEPRPSLLHGDLWAGNASFMDDGTPVIFDPAAYFGDREADLAMTEMFGGYPAGFYAGYNEEWPLDAGYSIRKHLYLLYHTLNHYNLFGGGYGSQSEALVRQLLQAL